MASVIPMTSGTPGWQGTPRSGMLGPESEDHLAAVKERPGT
jgi:hypothetical protein